MIVSEFIDWLKTQDQGATVQVLVRDNGCNPHSSCSDYSTRWENFVTEEHVEYLDMRGNPRASPDAPYFNARTLFLGLEE